MPIATQSVFTHTDALVKTWKLAQATPKNTLVIQSGIVGCTLTDTTGLPAKSNTTGYKPYTIGYPNGAGVGNDKATAIGEFAAGVALDGTWEFSGIVSTGTTPAPVTVAQNAPVYAKPDGNLTLESNSGANTRIGVVNYPATYFKVAGTLPIAIGL